MERFSKEGQQLNQTCCHFQYCHQLSLMASPTTYSTIAATPPKLLSPNSTTNRAYPSPPVGKTSTSTSLAVRIQGVHLLVITLFTACFVGGVVVFFLCGVDLIQFDTKKDDSKDRSKQVDDYNSYSANVATAISRLISIAVGFIVQVMLLRFATGSEMQTKKSRLIGIVTMVLISMLEYLVLNGFNALNVQLHSLDIRPVISMSDLSAALALNNDTLGNVRITNASWTLSEATPYNPVTNTVLRNLILPRVPLPEPRTRYCAGGWTTLSDRSEDTVDYGFPARSWQKDMLPRALDTKSVRIPIPNITKLELNAMSQLPMNASTAATLFLQGLYVSTQYFWWFPDFFSEAMKASVPGDRYSGLDFFGLLPTSKGADEHTQRLWFLERAREILSKHLSPFEENVTKRALALDFSHVDITPNISFDAMSFDVRLDSYIMGYKSLDNGTRFSPLLDSDACGPFPGICMFHMPQLQVGVLSNDIPAQVAAFSVCLNEEDGSELPYYHATNRFTAECDRTSTSSIYIMSIAKRLAADGLYGDAPDELQETPQSPGPAVTGLHKIYTFSLSRLAWRESDLAETFQARCDVQGDKKCNGIQYSINMQQLLIASSANIRLNMLQPIQPDIQNAEAPVLLVSVVEKQGTKEMIDLETVSQRDFSGPLLPHNAQNFVWDPRHISRGNNCTRWVEDRLHVILSNHLYIEHTLQTSYTAGMYFLFQDAMVRNLMGLANGKTTLDFDNNIGVMTLRLSIPLLSVIISLAGCTLLCLGAVAAVLYTRSRTDDDPLLTITDPQVITQILFDEARFPPLMLHRDIVWKVDDNDLRENANNFSVATITLQDQGNPYERQVEFRSDCLAAMRTTNISNV